MYRKARNWTHLKLASSTSAELPLNRKTLMYERVKFSRVLVKRSKIRPSPETFRTSEKLSRCFTIGAVTQLLAHSNRRDAGVYWGCCRFRGLRGKMQTTHYLLSSLEFWFCFGLTPLPAFLRKYAEGEKKTSCGTLWGKEDSDGDCSVDEMNGMWQIMRFSKGKLSLYMKFSSEIMVQWHVCILNERAAS